MKKLFTFLVVALMAMVQTVTAQQSMWLAMTVAFGATAKTFSTSSSPMMIGPKGATAARAALTTMTSGR